MADKFDFYSQHQDMLWILLPLLRFDAKRENSYWIQFLDLVREKGHEFPENELFGLLAILFDLKTEVARRNRMFF